jgi:acetyl esterase/lipase
VEENLVPYAYDPELAAALALLPVLDFTDLPTARGESSRLIALMSVPDLTGVQVEDRLVPGAAGDPEVKLRIYRPEQTAGPGVIYNVHGGGFTIGDLELDHTRNLELAREVGVVVVSVDYRLAPETPYPGPLEDVYTGLVWMAKHADELNIDPQQIALHGVSAGGGLCAALTLLARDRGGPQICFQYLAIPELDDRLNTASMNEFTDTPFWNRPNAVLSWDCYLGAGTPGGGEVSPYAAPARATDLTGLPPAYLSVMQFDPLRDEGIAYATALLAAGVPTELHLFPGTFHGSVLVAHAEVSQRERAEAVAVLRKALIR